MNAVKKFNSKAVSLCLLVILAVMSVGIACSSSNSIPDNFTAEDVELSDIRVAVTALLSGQLGGAEPPASDVDMALLGWQDLFTNTRAGYAAQTSAAWAIIYPQIELPFADLSSDDYTVTISGNVVDNATLTDLIATQSNAIAYFDALIRETTAAVNQ